MKRGEIPSPPTAEYIAGLIASERLPIPPGGAEKLAAHAGEMLRWNRSIRLTAITGPKEVTVKHILDSLFLLRFSPFPGRVMDFGSGAGYPGIPLAVALPETTVTLLESSGKKCAFLSHVLRILSLDNAEVVRVRLERGTRLPIGTFEHILTRATLPPDEAIPLLLPYLAPAGRLLLMSGPGRGKAKREERGGAREAGVAEVRTVRFELPFKMGARQIREIRVL